MFNGIFRLIDGDYEKAINAYTKAIEIRETAVYLANRSLAYLRTECFGYALDDASKAISLDSSYVKVCHFNLFICPGLLSQGICTYGIRSV